MTAHIEYAPPAVLREAQNAGLQQLIARAMRVAFYRQRLASHGLDAAPLTVDALPRLPCTHKEDLRRHYPYGLWACRREDVVEIHASSGTTDKPTVMGYTAADLRTWKRAMARTLTAVGVTPDDVVQNAYGYGLFTGGLGFHDGCLALGAAVMPISGGRTAMQLTSVEDFGSTVLCCTPSFALYLAATALMHGYGPPAARAQSSGGTRPPGPLVPVPARARPPQMPPKGYLLDQLGDGLYGIRDGIDQSLFLVSRRGVAAVDAPAAFGEKVLAAIAEVTSQPVTHVLYSHAHVDHIGAAHLFPPTATVIVHERTAERLRRAHDPRRPVPTQTVDGAHNQVRIGDHQLFLDYHGTNHLPGNLFIHAPQHRLRGLGRRDHPSVGAILPAGHRARHPGVRRGHRQDPGV
jgi:Metallo-beta-lactamase superfamily